MSFSPGGSHHRVALKDVAVIVRIGIADWERHKPQRLLVDVEMFRAAGAFTGKSIADCINYDEVFRFITEEWPKRPHTDLLETLVEELVAACFRDKTVAACRVAIRKPDVYDGQAVPGVEFYRVRSES
jgi:dihydroneopterin aldolase